MNKKQEDARAEGLKRFKERGIKLNTDKSHQGKTWVFTFYRHRMNDDSSQKKSS